MNAPLTPDERLFEAARSLEGDDRSAYLDRACSDDAQLRRRVEALLEASETPDSVLDMPVTAAAPALRPQHPQLIGDSIGNYKLLQQIGEGGFGVVYMAEQSRPVKRKVALKVIKPGMDTNSVVARLKPNDRRLR